MARKKIPYKELKRLSREVDREMKPKVDVRKLVNYVRKLVNYVKNWRPEMKKVEIEKNKTTGRLYITYNPKLEKKFKLGATRKFTITENK
jgi:hypothetical protein